MASVLPGHSTAVRPGTRRQHPATVPWSQCQRTQERERCAQILKARRKTSDRVRLEIKDRKGGGRRKARRRLLRYREAAKHLGCLEARALLSARTLETERELRE